MKKRTLLAELNDIKRLAGLNELGFTQDGNPMGFDNDNSDDEIKAFDKEHSNEPEQDNKQYANIVFLQGDEAHEVMDIINNKGELAALQYLQQWDNGDYDDISDEPFGSNDKLYKEGDYVMAYNTGIPYVGLSKLMHEEKDLGETDEFGDTGKSNSIFEKDAEASMSLAKVVGEDYDPTSLVKTGISILLKVNFTSQLANNEKRRYYVDQLVQNTGDGSIENVMKFITTPEPKIGFFIKDKAIEFAKKISQMLAVGKKHTEKEPVQAENQEVINKFKDQYGKKGKDIYYATANKQHRNPETFNKNEDVTISHDKNFGKGGVKSIHKIIPTSNSFTNHSDSNKVKSTPTRIVTNNGMIKSKGKNEEVKPSSELSDKKKSATVKKAKKGEDIGKPGKNFDKVAAKAAKEYGSEKTGEKVAAASMWKNLSEVFTNLE